jgi:hypothetical protein
VVTGPPGTGKSLLAVLRAGKIFTLNSEAGGNLVVLSKNKPLNTHLRESIAPALTEVDNQLAEIVAGDEFIRTYDSWSSKLWHRLPKLISKYRGRKGPMIAGLGNFGYDWESAGDDLIDTFDPDKARLALEIPSFIIVDEGQDLPSAFYEFLTKLGCNITVFADENQMIFPDMSKIDDIKKAMRITKNNGFVFEIKKNFRNTRQVAEVASAFYVGLPTGIPDLPDRVGSKPACVEFKDLRALGAAVASLSKRKRGMGVGTGPSVGVIVMGGKDKAIELQQIMEGLDEEVDVRRYVDSETFDLTPFKFDEPETVTIVSQWTQKGLEWDHVVVWLDGLKVHSSPERRVIQMMQCYVAASRPRARLVLAWSKSHNRNDADGTPEVLRKFLKPPLAEKVEDELNV